VRTYGEIGSMRLNWNLSAGVLIWEDCLDLDQVSASAQRQIQNREVDLERSEKGLFSVGPLTSFITFLQSVKIWP